jgi:hypothetical protein
VKRFHQKAIKEYIEIVVAKQLPLHGGVSGAGVYFIEAIVKFPGLEEKFKPRKIRCVIKSSAKEDFEVEKTIYGDLTEKLRALFVDFASPGRRALIDGRCFMIMPLLEDYQTLAYIAYHGNEKEVESSIAITLNGLDTLHFFGEDTRKGALEPMSLGRFLNTYLGSIHNGIERNLAAKDKGAFSLRSYLVDGKLFNSELVVNGEMIQPYAVCYEKLLCRLNEFAPPYSTTSHGDCHSRNIMINLQKPDLKFIDIDKVSKTGDYIYDYGTLVSDLEVYNAILQCRKPAFQLNQLSGNEFSYRFKVPKNIGVAINLIKEHIQQKTGETDKKWKERILLSEARHLLDMASKTQDSEKAFVAYCEGLKCLNRLVEKN